jgi:hypothetical protein
VAEWQQVTPLGTEDGTPAQQHRSPDLVALVPGVLFIVLAVTVMAGVDFPVGLFRDGGLLWLVLIGAGVWLLVNELRKARRRR